MVVVAVVVVVVVVVLVARASTIPLTTMRVHYLGKELIFETFVSDNKVDDGTLGKYLGSVVGVGHAGLQVELEIGIILHIITTDLDEEVLPFVEHRS